MKTTIDFLEAIKSKHNVKSNYALAKLMNQTDTAIARWMHGKNSFSDETAMQVAELLDIDPAYVVACVHAERAKHTEEKKLWERIAAMMQTKEFAGATAALLVLALFPMISIDPDHLSLALTGFTAATFKPLESSTVYYVKLYAHNDCE